MDLAKDRSGVRDARAHAPVWGSRTSNHVKTHGSSARKKSETATTSFFSPGLTAGPITGPAAILGMTIANYTIT